MKYLLDTHTLLWYLQGNEELSSKIFEIIINRRNKIFISIVSFWEIAVKLSIKKLDEKYCDLEFIRKECKKQHIKVLPITIEGAISYKTLPLKSNHRDPFDRMLIATAMKNEYTLVSKDSKFEQYTVDGLKLLW